MAFSGRIFAELAGIQNSKSGKQMNLAVDKSISYGVGSPIATFLLYKADKHEDGSAVPRISGRLKAELRTTIPDRCSLARISGGRQRTSEGKLNGFTFLSKRHN